MRDSGCRLLCYREHILGFCSGRLRDPGLEFLLYGLQSPINIGMILRVAETYRFHVAIYDPFCLLDHPDKLRTISDFSCGAFPDRAFVTLPMTRPSHEYCAAGG